jgi:putative endonuclease
MPDRRQTLGALGEDLAAAHLRRRGYEIVGRNFRTRWGELDIIARDQRTLVFCEVKTRRASRDGRDPLESVGREKQRRLRRMAGQWLAQPPAGMRLPYCRFDAIGITLDQSDRLLRLDHLEAAF